MNAPTSNGDEPRALTIRPATFNDLEAIVALETAAFATDRLSRRTLRRLLSQPRRPVLVARFGTQFAGYVVVVISRSGRSARIYSVAVAAAQRRRGVGRELMSAAERYARAHACHALRLEARYDNVWALALYRKLGYEEIDRYPGYYADGAEALRFEKRLAPSPEETADPSRPTPGPSQKLRALRGRGSRGGVVESA